MVAVPYTNVVTQASTSTGVQEQHTNSLGEGAAVSALRLESGALRTTISLAGIGGPASLDLTLLRSPVRERDQYVQFDQRLEGALADLDGDSRRDALDLAVYTQVIGNETVDLASRRAVLAIRVETTTVARVRGSTGALGDVERGVQTIWYSPGIGVVRTLVDLPSEATPGARDLTSEELDSWDGLTEGLGALAPLPLTQGGSSSAALQGAPRVPPGLVPARSL